MSSSVKLDLFLIVMGAVFLISSPSHGIGTAALPGSAMVPAWLAGLLVLLAVADLLVSRVQRSNTPAKTGGEDSLESAERASAIVFILIGAGSLLLTGLIGLLPGVAVMGALMSWRIGWGPRWKNIALGVSLSLILYYLFTVTFQIEFPTGYLMDLIGG